MSGTGTILLLSTDIAAADALRESISKANGNANVEMKVTARPADFGAELTKLRPAVALLDVDLDWAAVFSLLGKLPDLSPETRPLLLCKSLTTQLALDAMQAGARYCLEKSNLPQEFPPVLARFLEETARGPVVEGKVLTVVGAAGGCGATSLAVHLAHEFGRAREETSLIVDLDLAYGGVAAHLGLDATYGIADVLSADENIEPGLVQSTASVFDPRMHVLVSPASTDPGEAEAALLRQLARRADSLSPGLCPDRHRRPALERRSHRSACFGQHVLLARVSSRRGRRSYGTGHPYRPDRSWNRKRKDSSGP